MGFASRGQLFCQTIIRKFDVAVNVHQNILRFQVSIDVPLVMEVGECLIHLRCIELSLAFAKPFQFFEMLEEFSSSEELHHKENLIL